MIPATAVSQATAAPGRQTEQPHWWLAAMLLALHAGTAWGMEQGWARGLLLAHFGLFLLWQPLWRGEREVSTAHAAVTIAAVVALAAAAGWWLLALWLAMMFGLLGGRATGTADTRTRITLLLAAAYVLALLLAWVVPHLFASWRPEPLLVPTVRYALPVLLFGIFLVPVSPAATGRNAVALDLFYAIVLFLLVMVLVLGSFVLYDGAHGRYGYALVQMLFGLAVLLAGLSWLWNPHGGYAGLQQLLSRYAAGLGLPFERWIAHLAQLAADVPEALQFVSRALDAMVRTARIKGVDWRCAGSFVTSGSATRHELAYEIRGQKYTLYLAAHPTTGLALHLKLLAEVIAHFYEGKLREQRERDHAYERAIHETGARLTHDVKNVLQSLRALCTAASESGPDDDAAVVALLRRQLPALAERMTATLNKLRAPAGDAADCIGAAQWWDGLKRRYEGRGVAFVCDAVDPALAVPQALFDGAAENLIDNALRKGEAAPRVTVKFSGADRPVLEVADDGAAVPEEIARDLLRQRVQSGHGLGIGLYHCAMHAARLGYRLTLASNVPGAVRFVLAAA